MKNRDKTARYEQSIFERTLLVSLSSVLMLAVSLTLGSLLHYSDAGKDLTAYLLWLAGITVVSTIVPPLIFAIFRNKPKAKKQPILTAYFNHCCPLSAALVMVLFGTAFLVLMNSLIVEVSQRIPALGGGSASVLGQMNFDSLWVALIALCVVPAVCEEFAYRGMFMGILAPCGEGYAIVVSSLLFAFMHSSLIGVVFAFFSGLILALIRKSTGRLWSVMTVHFLNNAIAVGLSVFQNTHTQAEYLTLIFYAAYISAALVFVLFLLLTVFSLKGYMNSLFWCSHRGNRLGKGEKTVQLFKNPAFWIFIVLAVVVKVF